jgi:hypothetical protein
MSSPIQLCSVQQDRQHVNRALTIGIIQIQAASRTSAVTSHTAAGAVPPAGERDVVKYVNQIDQDRRWSIGIVSRSAVVIHDQADL